jgi:hypothetical protein
MVPWPNGRGGMRADQLQHLTGIPMTPTTTKMQPQAAMPAAARACPVAVGHVIASKPWSDGPTGITGVLTGFDGTNRPARLLGGAPT